ncbi:hypothetical protein ILUMI_25316 [Ignelater luminosus]|uniref:HTH psq-type domain-containing protein n=1 Tax=Ignelater luminosus TaxID=2038154 RepID=A0A8K0FZT1_IGNLU|nr:hypothetical protein ILUMI_25316 [Ignelater luminosus]
MAHPHRVEQLESVCWSRSWLEKRRSEGVLGMLILEDQAYSSNNNSKSSSISTNILQPDTDVEQEYNSILEHTLLVEHNCNSNIPSHSTLKDISSDIKDDSSEKGYMFLKRKRRIHKDTVSKLSKLKHKLQQVQHENKLLKDLYKNNMFDEIEDNVNKVHREKLNKVFKTKTTTANCENRWRVVDSNYKKYINNNGKTGRGRKNFEFLSEIKEIFGQKKNIDPDTVLSSETVSAITMSNDVPIPSTSNLTNELSNTLRTVSHYIKKRKPVAYTAQQLLEAVEAVRSKQMTLHRAAEHYGIPKSTFFKRVKALRGMKSSSVERPPAIPHDVEVKKAEQIKIMEKWRFGLSKKEILLAIGQYVKENGLQTLFKNLVPGDDYFVSFKRWHGLSQKKPQAVEVARNRNVDPFIIAKYFNLLKEVTSNLPPKRIYIIDETSFCLDPSQVKVVDEKRKVAHRVTEGPGKESFSVLMEGEKLPPLIIFKGKNVWDTWLAKKDDEYPGMSYAANQNGWIETATFANYYERTFSNSIPEERPVVLIYDGHSSHTSIGLRDKAMRQQVVILKLPPRTSHLLDGFVAAYPTTALARPKPEEYPGIRQHFKKAHPDENNAGLEREAENPVRRPDA